MNAIWAITFLSELALASSAKAKIKCAIVGGVAGDMADHGELGAAAACVVRYHEA
jgi:hypothetical protein